MTFSDFPFLNLLYARRPSFQPNTIDRHRSLPHPPRRARRVWVAIGCAMLVGGGLTMRADLTDAQATAQSKGTHRLDTPSRSTTIALTSDDQRLVVVNREAHSVSVIQVRDTTPQGNGIDVARKLAEIPVGLEPRCVAVPPTTARPTSRTVSAAPSQSSA
jgi:hypothetical protein